MDYTQSRGNYVELACLAEFMKYGIECSIPYGNGAKYDFIADINGNFIRIQCKSSKKIDEVSFCFNCTSSTTNTQKTVRHRYTEDMIDFFATEYENQIYLIPVQECSTSKTLRLAPPQNDSNKWNDAKTYQLKKVLAEKFNIEPLVDQEQKEEHNKKKYYCIDCGQQEVSGQGKRCRICQALASRIVERPSREDLKEMIRKNSWVSIANQFGVSDKAIVKWCIQYNLPSRKSDIKKISDEDWEII